MCSRFTPAKYQIDVLTLEPNSKISTKFFSKTEKNRDFGTTKLRLWDKILTLCICSKQKKINDKCFSQHCKTIRAITGDVGRDNFIALCQLFIYSLIIDHYLFVLRYCELWLYDQFFWIHVAQIPIFLGQSYDCLHYCDVIMGAIASRITSLPIVYLTVYSTSRLRVTGLCAGNSPVTNSQEHGNCFHLMTSSCNLSDLI